MDINCDMGESRGDVIVGNDAAIFPYISSCNIACGFHGGDAYHMQKTIELAIKHKVRIGAHPSFPDLEGFGRREMDIPLDELVEIVNIQLLLLKEMTESLGGKLEYVKPHGALYNMSARNEKECLAVLQAIKETDASLQFMGLANSLHEILAKKQSVPFISEAFADRRYTNDGQLVSRTEENAVIHHEKDALNQVRSILLKKELKTIDGNIISIKADSFCVHGDNPNAIKIANILNEFRKLHMS